MSILGDNIRKQRMKLNMSQDELARLVGYKSRSSINKIEMGINDVTQSKIQSFANALLTTPAYLMGWDDSAENTQSNLYAGLASPTVTDDVVTFPVIGTIAAGYDTMAYEDWSGETVDVPAKYLKNRPQSDYFVLQVQGDSMYPFYLENDYILVLKQETMDHSGQVGAILYDSDFATLKKIEYVSGEDWLRLLPLNPLYKPETITGADLERCRVLGIPKLVIREVNE